jgi:hypothetical protein
MPFKKGDPNINRLGRIKKKEKPKAPPPPPPKRWTSAKPLEGRCVKGMRIPRNRLMSFLSWGESYRQYIADPYYLGQLVDIGVDHENGDLILFFDRGSDPIGPGGHFDEITGEWGQQESCIHSPRYCGR